MSTPFSFKHKCFVLRHGLSVPNVQGIICSKFENGWNTANGLSAEGRADVAAKAPGIAETICSAASSGCNQIVLLTSPFSRARETAEIILDELKSDKCKNCAANLTIDLQLDMRLQERNFGALEGTPDTNYARVWQEDAANKDEESSFGAESLRSVWNRVCDVLSYAEKRWASEGAGSLVLVLVAHGDVLQIMQAGIKNGEHGLMHHRSLPHLSQAELRRVI